MAAAPPWRRGAPPWRHPLGTHVPTSGVAGRSRRTSPSLKKRDCDNVFDLTRLGREIRRIRRKIRQFVVGIHILEPKRLQISIFRNIFSKLISKVLSTVFFTSEVDAESPLALRKNSFKRVGVHSRARDQHRDEVTAKTTKSKSGTRFQKKSKFWNRVPNNSKFCRVQVK